MSLSPILPLYLHLIKNGGLGPNMYCRFYLPGQESLLQKERPLVT